jgi:hypothetical protein
MINLLLYLKRVSRIDKNKIFQKLIFGLFLGDFGDPSLHSQRRLLVIIHDQNDCTPKFVQSNYQFRLSETTINGFLIGHVQAIDNDVSPDFRRIQYKIIDNENNHMIQIDPNNGSIYLREKLSAGMTFNVTAMAIDQHNHSLYDQTNVQIILFDEATCLPTFTQKLYIFNTTEHRLTPYEIGKFIRRKIHDCILTNDRNTSTVISTGD